jgi:hypothetical protein
MAAAAASMDALNSPEGTIVEWEVNEEDFSRSSR